MKQVKMPEPIMYGIMEPDGTPYFGELCVSGNKGDLDDDIYDLNDGNEAGPYQEVALITTAQAEAYADARVREALELAAQTCENQARASSHLDGQSFYIALGQAARAIRALIPPLPGPVEPTT